MSLMPEKFLQDYNVMFGESFSFPTGWGRIAKMGSLRMVLFGRIGERCGVLGWVSRVLYLMMARRRGVQIEFSDKICGGLVLAHAYGITVNASAVLGEKCMLFKGCTIGGIRQGPRRGVPKLGCRVVVGLNATVVGGVSIGDDVMIAPGAFVNFDVPSHSVVIGNPGVIHHKVGATKAYYN